MCTKRAGLVGGKGGECLRAKIQPCLRRYTALRIFDEVEWIVGPQSADKKRGSKLHLIGKLFDISTVPSTVFPTTGLPIHFS